MKISEIYPPRFANGEALKGKAYTFTIRGIQIEEVHPQPGAPAEKKPVLYFQEALKGIIQTPPFARSIVPLLGDETDHWVGKRITIYPVTRQVGGITKTGIRARAATNGPSEAPAEFQEEEEDV